LTSGKNIREIQGLRALAVLAVVSYHFFSWPRGGFLGVDVFFVISGFVITRMLSTELLQTGSISLKNFYYRRIKRLLPASMLVSSVSLLGAWILFSNTRFVQSVYDFLATSAFAMNFRLIYTETNYFESSRAVSPLEHYWSLAVEEQFYFVWPIALISIALISKSFLAKETHLGKYFSLYVTATIVLMLFIYSMFLTSSEPTRAYFSTETRAWELGLGAFVALYFAKRPAVSNLVSGYLGSFGLIALLLSLVFIGDEQGIPAPLAAFPALATAAIITGSQSESKLFLFAPLRGNVAQFLGDRSYSLYLWHFPVFIFGTALFPSVDLSFALIALSATFAISFLSFYFVENPIRNSNWLIASGKQKTKDTGKPRSSMRANSSSVRRISFYGLCALAISLSVLALIPKDTSSIPSDTNSQATQEELPENRNPSQSKLELEIQNSLMAQEWPRDLNPSLEDAISGLQAPSNVSFCGDQGKLVDINRCTWGNGEVEHRAVIVGDSVSMTYVNPIRLILPERWSLTSLGTFACPFTDTFAKRDKIGDCADRKLNALNVIKQMKPDVVFISNSYWQGFWKGEKRAPTEKEWFDNMSSLGEKLSLSVGKIVFLAAPPAQKSPDSCFTKFSKPNDCKSPIAQRWFQIAKTESDVAQKHGGAWVNSSKWFCLKSVCPMFVGKVPVRRDLTHMTPEMGVKIAPAISEEFETLGIWTTD
jgi:peptidoglycan/LPS O-acetylase OafA/YrhL